MGLLGIAFLESGFLRKCLMQCISKSEFCNNRTRKITLNTKPQKITNCDKVRRQYMNPRSDVLQHDDSYRLVQDWEEQRIHPRHYIEADVQYRTFDMTTFESGVLLNLSQTGALLSLRRSVPMNIDIHIVIAGDENSDLPIHIIATVVRRPSIDFNNEGYLCACQIVQITDLN